MCTLRRSPIGPVGASRFAAVVCRATNGLDGSVRDNSGLLETFSLPTSDGQLVTASCGASPMNNYETRKPATPVAVRPAARRRHARACGRHHHAGADPADAGAARRACRCRRGARRGARRHAGGLMRVNHVGEICAQALYEGHALTVRDERLSSFFLAAADEERDHLAWTRQRLRELDASPSLLNPVWYLGSLSIGALAGLAGGPKAWDSWRKPNGRSKATCRATSAPAGERPALAGDRGGDEGGRGSSRRRGALAGWRRRCRCRWSARCAS